ncbi:MAG: hypothetical protein ACRD1M_11770, partial [Terriglobales bacterium]
MRRAAVAAAIIAVACAGWAQHGTGPQAAASTSGTRGSAAQGPAPNKAAPAPLSRTFATGWMLQDTNGDGLADAIRGHIVVPGHPSAAENTAAANLAARLTHGAMAMTPPIVVPSTVAAAAQPGPNIYVAAGAVPTAEQAAAHTWQFRLAKGEGRVVELAPGSNTDILVLGGDDPGLIAAADAYSARAPYQWDTGARADELSAIAVAVNAAAPAAHVQLVGLDYIAGEAGIAKAYLTATGPITAAELSRAFAAGHLAAVRELFVLGGAAVTATNPKPFHPAQAAPAPPGGGPEAAAGAAGGAAPAAA